MILCIFIDPSILKGKENALYVALCGEPPDISIVTEILKYTKYVINDYK